MFIISELAVTYPGVQAVDDATLLCTCGAKVKLGRARMLHNYSNCKFTYDFVGTVFYNFIETKLKYEHVKVRSMTYI